MTHMFSFYARAMLGIQKIHKFCYNSPYSKLWVVEVWTYHFTSTIHNVPTRDGNGRGGAGPKDGVFTPTPHGFVLAYPRLASHDKENFLALFLFLGALQSLAPPRKTLLLVNLPITITIVFNKNCFINKYILEITNNFISSNQTNF